MQPNLSPTLALILSLLAVCLAVWGCLPPWQAKIDAEVFSQQLQRLLAANNVPRMIKLCSAADDMVPSAAGIKRLLLRGAEPPPTRATRGYRDESGVSELVRQTLRAEYALAVAPMLHALDRRAALLVIALLATVGAAVLSSPLLKHPQGAWFQIALVAALLAAVLGARSLWNVHRQTRAVLERMLDPLEQAWLSGALREALSEAGKAASVRGARVVFVVPTPDGPLLVGLDDDIIKLGRQARCHVQVDHPSVAAMHAVIEVTGDGPVLIDLGSGTQVNGQPVNKVTLKHGDAITLGEVTLRVGLGGPP